MSRPRRLPVSYDPRPWADDDTPDLEPPHLPRRRTAAHRAAQAKRKHVKIPSQWQPPEALAVVAFLERVVDAIWRQHGPAMAAALAASGAAHHPDPAAFAPETQRPDDDESPF